MLTKFETNSKYPQPRLFIRTDNSPSVLCKKFQKYKGSPATHMNLKGLDEGGYTDSGYLSTFEFRYGLGLKSVLGYGAFHYVHFIFLHKEIAEVSYLTGGTCGLTHDGEQTLLINKEGSVWEIPYYQQEIPQIFFTQGVEVELGSLNTRSDYEVLLGGNWGDFAEIISVEKKFAHELLKEAQGKNEEEFYQLLVQNKLIPYKAQKNELQQIPFEPRWNAAFEKASLINWWNCVSTDKEQLIVFTQRENYPRPDDFNLLKELQCLHASKNKLEQQYPGMQEYFSQVQEVICKYQALSRIYTMYENEKQAFLRVGLGNILSDTFQQQLNANTVLQLCNELDVYLDNLKNEFKLCLLIRKIASLQLTLAVKESMFPGWTSLGLLLEEKCKKNCANSNHVGNLHELIFFFHQNTLDVKGVLTQLSVRFNAYEYRQHYTMSLPIVSFCNAIQESELPTKELAKWLRDFYIDYAIHFFQSTDDYQKINEYGKLMDVLLDNLKNLHDSMIKLVNGKKLEKTLKHNFLREIQNNIMFTLMHFKKVKESDPHAAGQEVLDKIKKLSRWATVISTGKYNSIYSTSARMFYEPFNNQKRIVLLDQLEPPSQKSKIQ